MLRGFFLSADLTEHLVGIRVVNHYSFLILEYNKQETLQNKTLDRFHDKKFIWSIDTTINIVSFKNISAGNMFHSLSDFKILIRSSKILLLANHTPGKILRKCNSGNT